MDNKAIEQKVKIGRRFFRKKPTEEELRRLYLRESKSIREVADQLGCSKDMVYRSLIKHGIPRRPNICRSKLRIYKHSTLKKGIKAKGVKGFALELDVHENTLRHYLKGVKEER